MSSHRFKFKAVAALLLVISSLVYTNIQFPNHLRLKSDGAYRTLRVYNPSCNSRQQGHRNSYNRRTLDPSPYFRSKLRQYENLHSRCGPLSQAPFINPTTAQSTDYCKYLVYTPSKGLGNRMISLVSTFLYALLTDRVLLVDFGPHMEHLFCEPFPNSTWFFPETFPLKSYQFYTPHFREVYSYGNLLRKKDQEMLNSTPSLVQIFLHDTYDDYDKLFFKDEKQEFLKGVPWLVLISTQYFVPCIFQMHTFRAQLEKWFPGDQVENVFYHLGNYLFNPSDQAWELIATFYQSHLAKAEERIGFQVRVFRPEKTPPSLVMKRILLCTQMKKLGHENRTSAILVASLSSKFYKEMKSLFEGGENVQVYQASHEVKQKHDDDLHNMKAWVDMYLLSMSDVLVTSSMSTFGYVAAGLGGIRPWILMISPPTDWKGNYDQIMHIPEAGCERAVNSEPCFHNPPWFANPDDHQRVGRCEDVPWAGLKLVSTSY